jgi:hypothetical protein
MKGRRNELTRMELHDILKNAFDQTHIYSEYGMTELLSQAYLLEDGFFHTPPWMEVFVRDAYDPFALVEDGQAGALNIVDLANADSCAFIATQDIGRRLADGRFEV